MSTLEDVASGFENLGLRIETTWKSFGLVLNTPLYPAQGFSALPIAPNDFILFCNQLAARTRSLADGSSSEDVDASEILDLILERTDNITFQSMQNDPNTVAKATIDFLLLAASFLPSPPALVDWELISQKDYVPRKLASRIRAVESRISELEPRSAEISTKISDIELAHEAAERLPTDMEELKRVTGLIKGLLDSANKVTLELKSDVQLGEESCARILKIEKDAKETLRLAQEAQRFTTSVGLAGAFVDRSASLTRTAWAWVGLLMLSLITAVYIGTSRFDALKALLSSSADGTLVVINVLAAVVGVGGPVWLAWLSTRNIGQSFKLAEDYAFKAAVSKAYEGYRREAMNLDTSFAHRLFGSTLDRLDELPSRFISSEDHGTPLTELLNNKQFKELMGRFPEAGNKLVEVFASAGITIKAAMASLIAGAAAVAANSANPPSKDADDV